MKNQIKTLAKISFVMLIMAFFFNQSASAQGRGFGSKGIKPATGTTQGVKWIDVNGDGICDNFVDANGDGINDNPQGYRGGRGVGANPANGVGRFGSASGVCNGTGKGRMGASSGSMNKGK